VHRGTALRKNRQDFLGLRREITAETAYGWRGTRFLKGTTERMPGPNGSSHFFMPNIYQFWARTRAKGFEDRKNLWDTKITWTVPVNDGTFAAFDVTHTPLEDDEARVYAESRATQQEGEVEMRWDLAAKVLAGDMTLEEIPPDIGAYTSFMIEDYVTQVGQGPVASRTPEMLAPTDAKLVLLRRLWLREINTMLEAGPMTEWKVPNEPLFEV
jgi:hypothetical protein